MATARRSLGAGLAVLLIPVGLAFINADSASAAPQGSGCNQTQIANQSNTVNQTAQGGNAIALQGLALNANAPVSVLSPGSVQSNTQSNSVSASAPAGNANMTRQTTTQAAQCTTPAPTAKESGDMHRHSRASGAACHCAAPAAVTVTKVTAPLAAPAAVTVTKVTAPLAAPAAVTVTKVTAPLAAPAAVTVTKVTAPLAAPAPVTVTVTTETTPLAATAPKSGAPHTGGVGAVNPLNGLIALGLVGAGGVLLAKRSRRQIGAP